MASPSDEKCPVASSQHHKEITMKTKFAKLALIAVLSTAGATAAFAHDAASAAAKQLIDLKDGSTLYVFKDGKMAVEDKYGHASRMKRGTELETKDGQKIQMQSDEVARLDSLLREGHDG
jgi:predicted lipoprotein with Yx(FWY)xxD motif